MTTDEFSTQTRFEMALLERLQQFEVTDEVLEQRVNRQVVTSVPPEVFDTDLIARIAHYVIDIEEFGDDFDSSEGDLIVNMGMFIYGFTKNYPELFPG